MRASTWLAAVVGGIVAATAVGLACWRYPALLRPAEPIARPTPVDVGFAQFMSLHHSQAIGMAQFMLDGRPTPLAGLARNIMNAQLLELGEMRGWLRVWNQPVLPMNRRDMGWMLLGDTPPDAELRQYLLDCQQAESGMSGLATDAELNELRLLDGRERDAHFLKLMLAHHRGAIPMARFAAEQGKVPVVRELATRIVIDQSEEIARILMTQHAMAATAATPSAVP